MRLCNHWLIWLSCPLHLNYTLCGQGLDILLSMISKRQVVPNIAVWLLMWLISLKPTILFVILNFTVHLIFFKELKWIVWVSIIISKVFVKIIKCLTKNKTKKSVLAQETENSVFFWCEKNTNTLAMYNELTTNLLCKWQLLDIFLPEMAPLFNRVDNYWHSMESMISQAEHNLHPKYVLYLPLDDESCFCDVHLCTADVPVGFNKPEISTKSRLVPIRTINLSVNQQMTFEEQKSSDQNRELALKDLTIQKLWFYYLLIKVEIKL